MGLRSLRVDRFRNLAPTRLADLQQPAVFLVGDNGQGKTNLLEAIYLLCFGGSFRSRRDAELIRYGEREAVVSGTFGTGAESTGNREVTVRITSDGSREIRVDGTRVSDRGEVVGAVPCVLFTHDDLRAIDGPPGELRRFFDQTAALSDPTALPALRRYRRVLRARNKLMRTAPDEDLTDVYDRQLLDAGLPIQRQRERLIDDYGRRFTSTFGTVFGTDIVGTIEYRSSWPSTDREEARDHLRRARPRDRALGVTTTGPHRDRFPLRMDGVPFRRHASTGQKRLACLALRAAQADRLAELPGSAPLLLLDDVLLELDADKRERFLAALPLADQAFFTFLPDERFDRYELRPTMKLSVRAGTVAPWTS